MLLPLAGRVVALAEHRQIEELAALLEKEGATTLRCPLVAMLDAPDPAPVVAWLRDLVAGRFDYVVLMTGEGVRRLLGFAERAGLRTEFIAALGRARTLTRGPKPVAALKEIGLAPWRVADTPTSDGVIAALKKEALAGMTVGVQLHGETVPALVQLLEGAGASVAAVQPYVYAPGAHAGQVADLIAKMDHGEVDLLAITSSPQVQRLFAVAESRGSTEALQRGLDRTCVAAVGPVAAESLRQHGARVDICPEQGFVMKNLVQHIKRELDRLRPR
jgi:uroporphyrinogen-III synthase